jgi:hypothetical protein
MLQLIACCIALSCSQSPSEPARSLEAGGSRYIGSDTLVNLNFEKYGSTEALRADTDVFATGNLNVDLVYLDDEVAYSRQGLTKSMRYDWINQGTKSISIGRGIVLPVDVDELWVEIAVRFSENFTPCNSKQPPCAHKTFFLKVTPDGSLRWALMFGSGGAPGPTAPFTMESPLIGSNPGTLDHGNMWEKNYGRATDFHDGRWWLLRWHVRHSTDPKTADALYEFELLDEEMTIIERYSSWEAGERFSTAADRRIRAILLGRNKDKGRDEGVESMWIGQVRAFKVDPGW